MLEKVVSWCISEAKNISLMLVKKKEYSSRDTDPGWKCIYTFYGFSYFFRCQTLKSGAGK